MPGGYVITRPVTKLNPVTNYVPIPQTPELNSDCHLGDGIAPVARAGDADRIDHGGIDLTGSKAGNPMSNTSSIVSLNCERAVDFCRQLSIIIIFNLFNNSRETFFTSARSSEFNSVASRVAPQTGFLCRRG